MRLFTPLVDLMEQRLLLTAFTVGGSNPTNPSIQSAINAANGDTSNDTITVAAGTYTEQLKISKPSGSLAITGQGIGSTIIQSPATLTPDANNSRNLVAITGGSNVSISSLTVNGPPAAGAAAIDTGIFVEGSSTATIQQDAITNIRDNPLDGVQTGVAIQVGQAAFNTVGTATINTVTISGYQKNGITVDGTGSSATITNSTITGAGPTSVIAQNGIQISRGALGTVTVNNISNNEYTGSQNTFATGIYLSQATTGTSATSNTLTNNDFGIFNSAASATTITLGSNTISGNGNGYGIYSISAGTTTINNNSIDGNYTGIDTDSSGSTTINGNILGSNSANSATGIEIDNGTVSASSNKITGSAIGINAVSYDGNVSLNLNGSTITNSTTGIAVDSTPDEFSTSVTIDSPMISPATTVTSNVSGAHGVVITGPASQLVESVAPTVTLSPNSPAITNNPSGSYNAVFNFSGSDNVTSANDLVYSYQLDGGPVTPTSSPLTLNNLSQGSHTLMLTVTDQGGQSTTISDTFSNGTVLGDGGFETPVVGTGNYQYAPTGTPWTYTGNAGVTGNNSLFTVGNPAAPEGVQVGFIQSTGSFSQSVNFQTAGSYNLTFLAAQRGNAGTSTEDFEILVDGQIVSTFKPTSTNYTGSTSATFSVTSGYHTITFTGIDSSGGDNTAFIDSVSLNAVLVVPVVSDGGFESPVVGSGKYQYDPTGTPWTYSGNAGVTGNNSLFTVGNPAAPEGVQVGFVQSTGSFSQSVNFPTSGSFTISFMAAQRGNAGTSREDFEIMVDGQIVGSFMPSSTSYQSLTSPTFMVTSGFHAITFVGLDTVGGDNTAFIDKVSLAAAPSGPVVGDGGFETPVVGSGKYQYDPTGTPWAYSGSAGVTGNNSLFTASNPVAPEGSQVGFVQGTGSFSQSVNFQTAGSFTLSFLAAQRGNTGNSNQNFEITIDGQVLQIFDPSSTSYQSLMSSAFTVTAGYHTIAFVGLNSAGGDNTAFIDNVTLAVARQAPAVVGDSGFENPVVGSGSYQYAPTGTPWTYSSNNAGVSGNNSLFTMGNPAAPEGSQVGFLQIKGSFSQSVNFQTAGSYTISFLAAQRGNGGGSNEDFEIMIDNQVVTIFKPNSTSYQSMISSSFTVTSGPHTITFLGLDTAGGDNTAFIDNITIASA